MQVEDLRCPGCGHPVSQETKKCEYCGRIIEITSFSQTETLSTEDLKKNIALYRSIANSNDDPAVYFSQGMCFLKLKLYAKALECFEKVISIDFCNAEAYFYSAVCVLSGKKPFLLSRAEINEVENCLDNAVTFKDCGIYRYFQAYVRYDYYFRKCFNVSPDYKQYLLRAKALGVSENDVYTLFKVLAVPRQNF